MPQPSRKPGPELSPAKRRQILAGAREAFAELGFERASVDLVASRAGVSKATVYNHFRDKQALFVTCFAEEADEMRGGLRASLGEPSGDVGAALQRLGEKVVRFVISPAIVMLFRHTVAEVSRFPDVGTMLFERGPAVVYEMIADYLRRWHDTGALRIDDPSAAAIHFVMMCQSDLALRAQLGVDEHPSRELVRERVSSAVRAFLRAYAP